MLITSMQLCSMTSQRNKYEDLKLVGLCEKSVRDIFFLQTDY